MSDVSQGAGWWQASDGKWYPPESHPDSQAQAAPAPAVPAAPAVSAQAPVSGASPDATTQVMSQPQPQPAEQQPATLPSTGGAPPRPAGASPLAGTSLAGTALEARVTDTINKLNPIGLLILAGWIAFMVLLAFIGFTT